jgi:hypothetical protein
VHIHVEDHGLSFRRTVRSGVFSRLVKRAEVDYINDGKAVATTTLTTHSLGIDFEIDAVVRADC